MSFSGHARKQLCSIGVSQHSLRRISSKTLQIGDVQGPFGVAFSNKGLREVSTRGGSSNNCQNGSNHKHGDQLRHGGISNDQGRLRLGTSSGSGHATMLHSPFLTVLSNPDIPQRSALQLDVPNLRHHCICHQKMPK